MTRDEARIYIRENWRDLILNITDYARDNVNGEPSYICPLCGHGENGDGLTFNPRSDDGNTLKCFGCDFSGDILDLLQKVHHIPFLQAVEVAAKKLNIAIDEKEKTEDLMEPENDFTDYYKHCQARLDNPTAVDYLTKRGISIKTAQDFGIGFDPKADPSGTGHFSPRLIIPITSNHYIGRSTDGTIESRYQKMNNRGAPSEIFNLQALYDRNEAVFVVEGVFDALSIIEAGYQAIALDSISNANKLLSKLKEVPTDTTLIISLDNEDKENVRKAEHTLRDGLDDLGIHYTVENISGKWKDPNEHLVNSADSFLLAIKEALARANKKPDNVCSYINTFMWDEIDEFKEYANCKTGYENLDKLSGGLFPGLYVLAAIPSLGKTTFMHQMADQIAAAGNDVIFFSLEQSRLELVTKSLARQTAIKDRSNAVTSLSIRKGGSHKQVAEAAVKYQNEIADRLSIVEGNNDCDCTYIENYVRKYIMRTKTRPVIIIDYLQILQPEITDKRKQQSAREMVGTTVTALRRLSRDLHLTVIAISSINRSNYMQPVDFESLKESGEIEYSCDVMYGLQLQCIETNDVFSKDNGNTRAKRDAVKDDKVKSPRKIQLVCRKNRFGVSSFDCYFDYYPKYDLFLPGTNETPF